MATNDRLVDSIYNLEQADKLLDSVLDKLAVASIGSEREDEINKERELLREDQKSIQRLIAKSYNDKANGA